MRFLKLAIVAVAMLGGGTAFAASPQWVIGYYVGYEHALLAPQQIGWNGLTHVTMGRVTAKADGSLDTTFDWDSVNGPALARNVSAQAHAAGKKAILMLGGAGNGAAILSAVAASRRAAFVANLVAAMNAYGYDGLDLDWEDSVNWSLFQSFVSDLRAVLPNAILTLPVGALNLNFSTIDPHLAAMAPMLDRINVMSYYPATAFAGAGWLSWFNSPLKGEKPATPVSIDTSLAGYANAGIDKQKLGMGMSFYAMCYTGGVTRPNQSTEGGVTIAGGDGQFPLSKLFGHGGEYNGIYRHWSTAAQDPFLSLPKPDAFGCRYVSYDDEASIAAKGKFSRKNGYGGIIVWTIGQGYVASHPNPNFLTDALETAFLRPAAQHGVAVSILQGDLSMRPGRSLRLAALVTGATDTTVAWSVQPAGCGSIDGTGLYTAPSRRTTCSVVATSNADPGKSATITVTVARAS